MVLIGFHGSQRSCQQLTSPPTSLWGSLNSRSGDSTEIPSQKVTNPTSVSVSVT
uniref:Uncharacterized protein n=1 Tax=Arion vulgaris TaxID=1028688 RepID=A0A0B6Y2R7_9EUPU